MLNSENGHAALLVLAVEAVDLILTDIVMPVLGGPEMAERVRVEFPQIPIIFMTGYSEYPIARSGRDNSIGEFRVLQKPFRRLELLNAIREELDRARSQ